MKMPFISKGNVVPFRSGQADVLILFWLALKILSITILALLFSDHLPLLVDFFHLIFCSLSEDKTMGKKRAKASSSSSPKPKKRKKINTSSPSIESEKESETEAHLLSNWKQCELYGALVLPLLTARFAAVGSLVFEYAFSPTISFHCFLCAVEHISPLWVSSPKRRSLHRVNCFGTAGICNEHGGYTIRQKQIEIRQQAIAFGGNCVHLDQALNIEFQETEKDWVQRFNKMLQACLRLNKWLDDRQLYHLLRRVGGFSSSYYGGIASCKPVDATPDWVRFFVESFCLRKNVTFSYNEFGDSLGGIDGTLDKTFDSSNFNHYRWEEFPLLEMRARVEDGPAHPQNAVKLDSLYENNYKQALKRGFKPLERRDIEFLQQHPNLLVSWYQMRYLSYMFFFVFCIPL
jgi:hypothetical protein